MKTRRGIQSIEVGGQLLRVLVTCGKPMALRDVAKQADMTTAKAHPYMVSFCNLGLVKQDPDNGLYELGPFALQLGLVCLQRLDAVQEARPELKELAAKTGQSIAIAIWGNMGPTIVAMEESSYPIHVNLRVGAVMSLMDTATGRVFGAFLPPKMTEKLANEENNRLSPEDAIKRGNVMKEFEESLNDIRAHMLAQAVGYPVPGINALSAPIFNHDGNVVLALTAMGPAGAFDASLDGDIANRLRQAAQNVSERLGYGVGDQGTS
ncbi:IclR family transcriptional regulator [Marinobacterium lutimaris]|nr:IclR family transcriptional regulator [Marinobacterium lutimaris]